MKGGASGKLTHRLVFLLRYLSVRDLLTAGGGYGTVNFGNESLEYFART